MEVHEKRTLLISRPKSFMLVFNSVKSKRECKNRYVIQPIPPKGKECPKVIICRAYKPIKK
jgi:hypothetical protein